MVCGLWSSHGAALPEDWQAYRSAQERAREVEKADPRAAIGAWYAIFKERPKLDAWVGVLACSELVRLHYERVKETKTALELCDWALKQYAGSPALARTAADKASVLLREGRPEEAEAAVAAHWDLVTRSYYAYSDAAVRQRFLALERQGKAVEGEDLLAQALKEIPQLLDEAQQNPKGWIYNRLVYSLTARQRAGEALSWAKARFVTCRYDPAAMERSGRALVGAWSAKDPTRKDARAFLAALRTPNSALSTQHSALPPVDQKSVAEILTRVQGGAQPTHDRISLHLLVGNVREAFLEARRLLVDNPEQPAGTLELCRVLKALELSAARANALVAYLKEGTGADPLPEALRPLGITPEALPAEVRAGQRKALANTPLVPGDALAKKLGQAAPLPETVAAGGLPAAMPLPVPTDPAALPQAAPAPTAAGAVPVPATAIPMPMPAKVDVALPAWAAPPATTPVKTGPVTIAGVEGVGPAPVKVGAVCGAPVGRRDTPAAAAPTVAATPGIAMPAPVREDLAAITMALTRLQAGEISPEAAWEEGKLTADDILRALASASPYRDAAYCLALAEILVTRCGTLVSDGQALDGKVRLCVAQYFASIKDDRCVSFFEGLLDPGSQAWIELAVSGLAEFHKQRGEYGKAAEACQRACKVSSNPAVAANAGVAAGRCLLLSGDVRGAEEAYQKVPEHGYGWATGMALHDRAALLMSQGKHEDARKLLQQPIAGRYADQIDVARWALLGTSYYATGDLDNAMICCNKAIAQYRSLGSPLTGEGLEGAISQAETCRDWISRWKAGPILADPSELHLAPGQPGSGETLALSIMTLHEVPITVRSRNGVVVIAADDMWQRVTSRMGHRTVVRVSAAAAAARGSFEDALLITSPDLPHFTLTVPVHIHVRAPIRVQPERVFVGSVAPGSKKTCVIRLTAPSLSDTARVETGAAWVDGYVRKVSGSSHTHEVQLRFHAPATPTPFFEGAITIIADGSHRQVIQIPYCGAITMGQQARDR